MDIIFLRSPLQDFLVKLLKKPFEKRINEILIQSQNDYLKKKYPSDRWIQLNDFLEIFFELENIYSNDRRPCSKLHIKNISNKILNRICLALSTTYNGNKKVKQSIEIENMNPKDIYVEFLDKIPLQNIILTEDETFICSHGSLSLKTKLIESEGIVQKVNDKNIDFISTGFSDLISDKTWIKKEDIYLNIKFLEFAKYKLSKSIYRKLVVDKELFLWNNNEIHKGILFYKQIDFRISQFIFKFLTFSQVLNAIFWFLLITKIYEIDDEGNLVRNK